MAYKPAGGDKIATSLVDADWDIVTASPITEVIVYNTRAVQAEDAPKSFKELLDPKWKGRLVHSDPNYSGSTTMGVNILSNMYGWEFYRKLAAQEAAHSSEHRCRAAHAAYPRKRTSAFYPSMPTSRISSPKANRLPSYTRKRAFPSLPGTPGS